VELCRLLLKEIFIIQLFKTIDPLSMDRWRNRVALITGAGSGIGACIAANLVKHGMTVIGCARNNKPIDVSETSWIWFMEQLLLV
jgi:lactate dehydrogenase-like 2-hydroxyacid dehydrogenase